MIIGISFKDVLDIPEFSSCNMFDLLQPTMDSKVAPYLYHMGANVDKHPLIQACLHRRLSGKQDLGYRYVYPERKDSEWLANSRCSMAGRIAAQKDKELASDMTRLSAQGMSWGSYQLMVIRAAGQEGMTTGPLKGQENPGVEYETYISNMEVLQAVQIAVRGPLGVDENMLEVLDGKY